jgi:hypothetical protein
VSETASSAQPMYCLSEMVVYRCMGDTLSAESAKSVAKHVNSCANCRELIASLADDEPVDGHAAPVAALCVH